MENQAYIFLIFILNGFLIGLLFDIFRILRKSFKTKDFLTYIQDFLFWILAGIIILYSLFKFNNGEIRGYVFLGIFIGVITYLFLFSKYFIKVNLKIIEIIKTILKFCFIIPIKHFFKFLKKNVFIPIIKTFNLLRNYLSNFKIKNIKK